jgi:phenylalanyl-tRNA synthetase beta chain
MPVVSISLDTLLSRIKTEIPREDLAKKLRQLGCDVEGYATVKRFKCSSCDNIMEITETENPPVVCDQCGADYKTNPDLLVFLNDHSVIRMELLAVRPDMFDPGGLARTLRGYLGEETHPDYELHSGPYSVTVDSALSQKENFRPNIACAIIRNMSFTEDTLRAIMKLQENLHWALGRDRKRASIGVYDLDKLEGTEFQYRAVSNDEIKFTPLGYNLNKDSDKLSPKEILNKHPKGVQYKRLLEEFPKFPLLSDAKGTVLSMPPIINGEISRVTPNSRDLFIDITGTDERLVNKTLNVFVTSVAELASDVKIEQVEIRYPNNKFSTPDFTSQKVTVSPSHAERVLGIDLDKKKTKEYLERMGHKVEETESEELTVFVPPYRNDILHPIDLVEDIAIAYGYQNFPLSLVPTTTVGKQLKDQELFGLCRKALTGLGLFEVLTLILSSEEAQYDKLLLPRDDDHVIIDNPISVEQTMIRRRLIPGLLDTFAANADQELPQQIFEVGYISQIDEQCETGSKELSRLAGAIIGPKVDYSGIRSICEALLREFGASIKTVPTQNPAFIPGRVAMVHAVLNGQEMVIGIMGEVHPQVLESFKLVYPVSAFEIQLSPLVLNPNK